MKLIHREIVEVPRWKKVDRPGGFTHVQDGVDRVAVEVHVDGAAIARRLAKRAWSNGNGRSKFMHGAVMVQTEGAT